MQDESINPDLVNELRKALGMAKKEMKELYAMGSLYSKSLTGATEEAKRSNFILGQQNGLVTSLNKSIEKMKEGTKERLQLENLTKQVLETANEMAASRNRSMADLVLKQQMVKHGLTDEYAEQAKNLQLLLDQGAITEGIYDMHIKRLQEDQKRVKHVKEEVELYEEIAAKQLEIIEEAESWKKSFTKISETAKAIARDPKVMGAFLLNEAVKGIEKGVEGFEEFKKQGLSAGQAMEAQMKTMSFASIAGLSDTQGVMNGVIEQYGNVNALSGDTVNELGKMAVHFGIAGAEAAKLNASLSEMPGETAETAAHAMEHVGHMAELQGIAPGKIMKDMAANTGAMALYGKGGAKAFGESAIQLHKMGVEIGTAAKMADGLLDFESSINKQMEASVLLGREINLDKARELALNGDLEGSTKEVLANIGGAAEFEKMNVMQKKALAEATGMTVEELQKSIDAQEESNKYFGEGTSIGMNALGYLTEYGSKGASFFKENGLLLLTSLQFLQNMNLTKVKGYASDVAHWVKEKAHWAWKATAGKLFGKGGGAVDKLSETATDQTKSLSDKTKGSDAKKGGGVKGFLKGLGDGLASIGKQFANVVKGAVALGITGIALGGSFAVAMMMLGDQDPVQMLAVAGSLSMLGLTVAILGKLGGQIIQGAVAMVILGAALIPAAFAFSMLGGIDIKQMAAFSIALPLLALAAAGLGFLIIPITLGAAALAALGVGMIAVAGGLAVLQAAQGGMDVFASLTNLALQSAGLGLVAMSIVSIGAGLGVMAIAGLAALPVIAALTGLAVVAPALAGLGMAIGGMFGGGGEDEDKMDTLIAKMDQLIAVASSGGEVKMDGKKVGEVVRLGLNSSGIR